MDHSFKDILVTIIICITVAYTITQFSNCHHSTLNITCDAKEDVCKKVLKEETSK